MFGKPIRLFRIFGFDIGIDLSWFILFMLITWSLALGLFPFQYPDFPFLSYVLMGILGALGLFASIVFHELAHSLVARRFGLTMKGITLFMFGGMSEMPEEPGKPRAEFWMAISGPLSSVALAFAFYGLHRLGMAMDWSEAWNGIIGYLAIVNAFLALFNMVPAFPLDGGRVLRSALWSLTGDFARATRIASGVGSGFGLFLFIFGAVRIIAGNLVGGVWWMLIGLFIRSGARASVAQMTFARILHGETVRNFMNPHPVTVSPNLPLKRLVEEYLYKFNYKFFPVTDEERVVGCIGMPQIKVMTPQEWELRCVGDAMASCPAESLVSADMSVEKALKRMQESGQGTLMIIENGRLLGVITTADILHYLTMKMEIEEAEERAASGMGWKYAGRLRPPHHQPG